MRLSRLLLATFLVLFMVLGPAASVSAGLRVSEPIEDIYLEEDESVEARFDLDDHFTNGESQLTFSHVSSESKVQVHIREDGTVDLAAPEDWFGSEEVTFIASDGEQEVSDTMIVRVSAQNDAPVLLQSPEGITFAEDEVLDNALNLEDHFFDVDSSLTFSSISENVEVSIDQEGNADLSAPSNWFGDEVVTFSAWDGEFSKSFDIHVKVEGVNDAPKSISGVKTLSLNKDKQTGIIHLKDCFSDVDDEVLSYEVTGGDRISSEVQGETLTLISPEDWSGKEIITLRATDSVGQSSSIQIVVFSTQRTTTQSPLFYMLGLVLAFAVSGVRLHLAGRGGKPKSPVKLESYRNYRG